MRGFFFGLVLLALISAGCAAPAAPAETSSELALEDCVLAGNRRARCGTLAVPEDHTASLGREIDLHVIVVPAISRNPQPDPLVLLAGGPGQAATEAFPPLLFAFEQINQDRDLVLVDQRGTGKSNPLRCFDPEDDRVLDEAALIAELKTCPDRLAANLTKYHTEIAMQDLDAVRAALGYERLNLYGASYGTRAALTYLRMYPERVRTVILDAVVDADFRLFQEAGRDGQRALEAMLARCEAEADCQAAFPALRAEFEAVLARLDAAPAEVTFPDPVTGRPRALTLTRAMFTNILFGALYAPEFVALLPLGVHEAYATENYAPLLAQAFQLDSGLYEGMLYAVACTEDAPLLEAAPAEGTVFGDRTTVLREVCAAWPKGAVSADFRTPVRSDTPTLLLSGEWDPITPPVYAEAVAESLPNSLHVIAPGMGHGILIRGCIDRLAREFIAAGAVTGLDPACAAKIAPPPFFVGFTGPTP